MIEQETLQSGSKKVVDVEYISGSDYVSKYENLKHVEGYCQKNSLQFMGFHYTVIQNLPKRDVNIDAIKMQVDTLYKKRIWLNDRFNQ